MANTTKTGAFLVGKDNTTYWSANGQPNAEDTPSASETSVSEFLVEKYTGSLSRQDEIPRKPVAAMSYG